MSKQQQQAPKDDRGARVVQEAVKILTTEGARGWSDALKKASERVK